jgi:sialic acid synthase SpsE
MIISPSFVAEVSSNHNGDLKRALEFVEVSADCGFSAVKFQLFEVEKLFSHEALSAFPKLKLRERWQLPRDFIPILAEKTHSLGMQFSCTPFDLESAEFLTPYVDFYKIASYELLWHGLIRVCSEKGIPLVLSSGMANLDEIDAAVSLVREEFPRTDLTLLHAVSSYPAPVQECNLAAISSLRSRLGINVGWSDHTVSPSVILNAVLRQQASMIEMHIDLDGTGYEYESQHCWLPEEAKSVIESVQIALIADGDGVKVPTPAEMPDRKWRADPLDGLRPLMEVRLEL